MKLLFLTHTLVLVMAVFILLVLGDGSSPLRGRRRNKGKIKMPPKLIAAASNTSYITLINGSTTTTKMTTKTTTMKLATTSSKVSKKPTTNVMTTTTATAIADGNITSHPTDSRPTTTMMSTTITTEEDRQEVVEEPKERIVTEFMLLRKGVPLDYSYNETAALPGDIVSSPGCPKSIDGYPWVIYGKSDPRCYLVGQHSAVCEGSAVMSYQKSSYFGICGCNFQECIAKQYESDVKGYQLLRRIMSSSSSRYTFCQPPSVFCEEYVYDRKEKRCHILYTRGPCGEKEWLQRDGKGGVECVRRMCPQGKRLTEDSEKMMLNYRNVTDRNAACCKPWGGFAVALTLRKSECKHGEGYSETLQKCVVMPFKASSLVIG